MNGRMIEIDFDVHKKIETERSSFAETPNEVLRRLLSIPDCEQGAIEKEDQKRRAWSGKGVILPHGTKLRMQYNGRNYEGVIRDGLWAVEGAEFKTPSDAMRVARTKDGRATNLNGWNYWKALLPNESDWTDIADLRPQNANLADLTLEELLG